MRVSTNQFYTQSYSSIQDNQNAVLKLQEQIASGKRVNKPSDDPSATAQINLLNKTINNIAQYKKNGDFASSQLSLEETQLNTATNVMQRAYELTIQMSNDTYNANDRKSAATEVDQLVKQMTNLMNSKDSSGNVLFGGDASTIDSAFIADTTHTGFFSYNGNTTDSRYVQISFDSDNTFSTSDSSRVRIGDSGSDVFNLSSTSTNTTTALGGAEPSMLNVLVTLQNALNNNTTTDLPDIGTDIKAGITQLSEKLSSIGGRQNQIDAQSTAGDTAKVALQQRLSNLQDMDMVQGASDLSIKQTSLQVAQQIFAKVQGMSLFDYIK